MKIEALPIGLKFSIAGVNFTTNVQYDIYGEVSIFIFDKELNTVAELNKSNAENVKKVLTNFILKNTNTVFSEKDINFRVKKIVDNLNSEIKTYNKAKVKPMAKTTKKPSAKQLAARKKFAAMAKAKAKAAKAKKAPAKKKTPAKKAAAKKTYQTGSSNKLYDSMRKAKSPGKRVSASGGVYYERRKNRSDMPGSLTGVNSDILKKYTETLNNIEKLEKTLLRNKETAKKFPYKTDFWKKHFSKTNAEIKKYLTELKKHKTQLKKLL